MTLSWESCTIQDFVDRGEAEIKTGPFGTQLHASDYVDEGIPVINARNIGFGEIRTEKLEFISEETVQRLSSHLLEASDIVFGRKGTVERHVFIQADQAGWFQGTDCLRLRLKSPSVDPRFVSYCFLTESHKRWMINQSSHGATMTSLNQDIIKRIPLRLPPLPTQRRIASILSAYDDLIENNTRRIKILEEMARLIYREWFVEFRAPGVKLRKATPEEKKVTSKDVFPAGWELKQLGDVSTFFRGKSYRSPELVDQGGLPFLNLKCIERGGGFRYDGVKRFQGEYKETHIAKTGDLIVAVTDMTQERRLVAHAARVHILDNDFAVMSMDLVRIEPKTDIAKGYLHGVLRFSEFSKEVSQHANGANVLHLNPAQIEGFRFALPPSALRDRYAEITSNLYRQCDVLQAKNANLRRTRDLLLPKLVSGEVEVEE